MKKSAILQSVDQLMGADESIHTVSLIWDAVMPCLPKDYGVCAGDISGSRIAKRSRPLPHQFVNSDTSKNETTSLAGGGFCISEIRLPEARVLPKMSWLQRETTGSRANARHSGCQPAAALGVPVPDVATASATPNCMSIVTQSIV